jgi:DNA-binding NtrC family response regulator
MTHRILIVDDEPKIGALLARSLEREGYAVTALERPHDALEALKDQSFDVLLTDLRMPGMDGLELLRRAREAAPRTEVVLMTAYASVETAREALTRGAVDYLVKPVSAEEDLKPLLRRLLDGTGRVADSRPASPAAGPAAKAPGLVTRSPAMHAILAKLDKIAQSNASVLLRGESGTGKEVMADLIQAKSTRARAPFLKVNCGALTETLLESELFGHVKGAYTGAVTDREGLFAAANGGTVMLDEIGEVSPALQVKLLRVLQSGDYTRVGENVARKADVRIIAATNRDLEAMIRTGAFRQDLYYRLNVVPIELPPLRERPEDIPALVELFASRLGPNGALPWSAGALDAMNRYGWPGNIRELENAVEHALVLGGPGEIVLDDLPAAIQQAVRRPDGAREGAPATAGGATLEDIEKRCLLQALEKTAGNRTRAARLLGVTRRTLGYRLRKYGLESEVNARFRSGEEEGDEET